ncbi:hypothetical protein [Chryseobacterium paridis]|uniref:Uncharacterized protein n=1 Tax=Chryseobacterium paridis TaxID=2800328 RepID=A0ABS1FT53_9FLAO|nr:hypothetical protein [Chryseobacterium paridis]MBK1895592.1 hypothetical protein [Chryseobacterium paridis]
MQGRFHQYLFTFLFALLTVLGLYSGQVPEYPDFDISFNSKSVSDYSTENNVKHSYAFLTDQELHDQYTVSHLPYHKLRANLSESDNENDDNVETSGFTELPVFLREDIGYLKSDFVTIFHNRQSAVSFANSEHLKYFNDDLYIQYRVIRL